jgi:hypothetical protein
VYLWSDTTVSLQTVFTIARGSDNVTLSVENEGKKITVGPRPQRFSWTCKAGETNTWAGIRLNFNPPEGIKLYAAMPQFEELKYATSFVNGSRTVAGVLEYALSLSGDFTIRFPWCPPFASGAVATDKTLIALTNGTNSINVFNGYGTDWYLGDETNRTRFRTTISPSYVANEWMDFALVRSGSQLTLYRNGESLGSFGLASAPSYTKLSLGGGYGLQSPVPYGMFAELQVLPYAASATAVADLYNQFAGGVLLSIKGKDIYLQHEWKEGVVF